MSPETPPAAAIEPTPVLEPGPRSIRAIAAIVFIAIAAGCAWGLFEMLNRIEQSGEEYLRWGQVLRWSTLGACLVVAAGSTFLWDIPHPGLRRSCRFAAVVAALSLFLALGPVPGGYLAGLLLMIAAARFAVAALPPVGGLFRPKLGLFPLRLSLASAIAAFLCAAAALCAIKLNGLGWAHGID